MKTVEIVNKQKDGKFAGTSRIINVPDWLLTGSLEDFQADEDIDQDKAFDAICNYARQHLPVAFRSKALTVQSCYAWLRGEMQGGSVEKAEGINTLVDAGMSREVLTEKSTKEIRAMVEVYRILETKVDDAVTEEIERQHEINELGG